jgi:hypothetical protein
MAVKIIHQFPGEIAPREAAYARHEGSTIRHGKTADPDLIHLGYYRDEAHRQAAGVLPEPDGLQVPAASEDLELQSLLDQRAALIDSLKAVEYGIAKKLRPELAAGEDC